MSKIALLTSEKNFYKGNMHCHSTLSDGKQTLEELKELFKSKGYSFLAITDHEIVYDNSHLDDEDFITITSAEYAIKQFPEQSTLVNHNMKVCHLNIYAKEQHNTNSVCYNAVLDHYSTPEKHQEMVDKYGSFERTYGADGINEIIKTANENGFFVAYNHPRWSLENYGDYKDYEGLWGVEIYNHACSRSGLYDYDINVFDDFHRDGKKLFASCGDDNHSEPSCGGAFVMVNTDSLTYDNIISALLKGDFYASQGPEIYDLYVEDNKVTVKCSNAKRISYSTFGRRHKAVNANEDGYVNEATFELKDSDIFFRIEVMDENGNRANSQAYYPENLK